MASTDDATPRRTLVLLFGGRSAEHDVSCVSARHVLAAVDTAHLDIVPVGIDREGSWSLAEAAADAHAAGDLPDALDPSGPAWDPLPRLAELAAAGPVVVFPLLHGPLGEDGTVQGLLEVADVPYVGAGVLGSALAMDKLAAREVLAQHGLPQARYRGLHVEDLGAPGTDTLAALVESLLADLGPTVFVKPANLGSSIGVSRATDAATLEVALKAAAAYDEWLVVEEAIVGREIELSVLGDRVPQVSGPGEIRPGAEFYDYADKYETDAAELLDDPDLDAETVVRFQELAARAFQALRCSGMARVDFFLPDDDRGPVLNEVNTIPGFTPISMYPRLWQKAGLDYPALIDRLVDLAVERHARRRRNTRH
ncbi:MAG: D-alanine--D-alanine ligase [Acidimicrobiaceae bacterium]|nr:D-alanine--D-alanine ligase [Acidimicrobiaceae bacterium]|tara:strand:- start:3213 stop:4316 length:1104 start_codon:yes stop_codon:yes gene_type:complete